MNPVTVRAVRIRLVAAVALAVLVAGLAPAVPALGQTPPGSDCPVAFPVDELEPGMLATGWTVSRGTTPEPFEVEILGVRNHWFLHDRHIVVVDADRPGNTAIDKAGGIWAGMSGSPVYAADGRLIGALAWGFSAGPSKLAGLTPAAEMLDLAAYPSPPTAQEPPESVPLTGKLADEVRRREGFQSQPELMPLPMPFPVRDQRTAEVVRKALAETNLPLLPYVAGGGGAALPPAADAEPVPGGNFAAALSYGDSSWYGSGTTSFLCDGRAYAFGHWMNASGPTAMGANDGNAIAVVDDPTFGPYKMMNLGGLFGTIDQDRFAGVRAELGRVPTGAAVVATITDTDRPYEHTGHTEIVFERGVPFLSAMHLWDSIDTATDRWGPGTIELSWTATGQREGGGAWSVTRDNMFASEWDIGFESLWELWDLLEWIQTNPFEDVTFADVTIAGTVGEVVRRQKIGEVEVAVDGGAYQPVHDGIVAQPGSVLDVRVHTSGRPGPQVSDLTVRVPDDAAGFASLLVTGGSTDFGEAEAPGLFNGDPAGPGGLSSFDDVLAAIEALPRNNEVVVRLFADGEMEPPIEESFAQAASEDDTVDRTTVDGVVAGEVFAEIHIEDDGTDPDPGEPMARLAGADRMGTAVAISRATFDGAGTVVIARADDYADALAGGPLAASVGGPLLLTRSTVLPPAVAEEISRLGAEQAIVLGGAAAVSEQVVEALAALGAAPQRIAGANRFDTARRIAEQLGGDAVYLALGHHADPSRGWVDAIAVSGLAATEQRPILLTRGTALPAETDAALDALDVEEVTLIGGRGALSDDVMAAATAGGRHGQRLAGATRYDTSLAVARRTVEAGGDPTRTWLASGRSFPDGLAAGPAVAATGGVLLLVDGADLNRSPAAHEWLAELAGQPVAIRLVGGEGAISAATAAAVTAAVGGPGEEE